jgi:hypothetical protein
MNILNGNKIENKIIFLLKLPMDELCLKFNKKYLVETRNKNYYIGVYKEFVKDAQGYIMYYILDDVTQYIKSKPKKLKSDAFFSSSDRFYDLEEIREKGKKAILAMEQRALNKILKRIVNENFEWL